ncbi:MAG: adenylyltransferase/cytidyltransferase family protein, partial [Lachnospiraceae bacterium]|nr:adenylyltransferase/cytidyltransferase family protein [Lachnospiraceae bacterium]
MEHITNVTELQLHNTAVALGKFDGFHRGHQLLLEQVRNWQEQGLTGVIFTFAEAGKSLGVQKRIDSRNEKLRKAEAAGIDILLEYPFTKEFSAMEPETFVAEILIKQLGVKAVAVG